MIFNLVFNIFLPIFILQKGNAYFNPTQTLLLALLFPLIYGVYDYLKNKHKNYISLLGILNVALTGGLALSGLNGIWFAIKEASFPLLIGAFVLASSFTENPLIKTFFLNLQFFNVELIHQKVIEFKKEQDFLIHLRKSTQFLSFSFLISSILNFVLALYFFKPISETLSAEEKSTLLNAQIAQMTSWSYLVIMAPSMLILFFVLKYVFKGLKDLTGLTFEEIAKATT